jgi:hypothetical protein
MYNFYYPKYNEKNLEKNKDMMLLNDYFILNIIEFIEKLNILNKKNYKSSELVYIKYFDTELLTILFKNLKVENNLLFDRIKKIIYYRFYTNYYNYKIMYKHIIENQIKDKIKIIEFIYTINNSIDLYICESIYKKHDKKYSINQIKDYLFNNNIEITDLNYYKNEIETKKIHYIKVFTIIITIYLLIIIILFIFIIYFEKYLLK